MKTMKFFSILCAVLMGLALTSCNKVDEPSTNGNGEVVGGDYEVGVWYEEGNKLIYVFEHDYVIYKYTIKWTLTFDSNDLCVKSECEYNFNDATMAQVFYEELRETENNVRKSGNTIIVDMTDEHAGLNKEELKSIISTMY